MARRGGMGATYDREGVQKSDVYHTARNLTLTLKSYIDEKKKVTWLRPIRHTINYRITTITMITERSVSIIESGLRV